ncbi:hypothetical protein ABT093_20035 [Kitasatospora sp. NPDC002551]|uniref:hypothetical protein n=1 Tax=Kitasatospora sp. NPDC002551 TaxID=3154539 RepID=UPI00332E216A
MTTTVNTGGVDDVLDDLLGTGGASGSPSGYAAGAGAAVTARAKAIIEGPSPEDTIDAVLRLAEVLPGMDDVREVGEDDFSDLTDTELEQKERTEGVIRTALATGDASVWVIAQGLERAKKGKWWRRSHHTYGEYAVWLTGRSAVYNRQLRQAAPLALEAGRETGVVPNPGQAKEMVRTEKAYDRETAVTVYSVIRDQSAALGERPTAAALRAAHEALPETLPDVPEQKRAVIEAAAREVLGLDEPGTDEGAGQPGGEVPGQDRGAAIAAPVFEEESNKSAAIAAPGPETVPETPAGADGREDHGSARDGGGPAPEVQGEGGGTDPGDGDDIPEAEIVPEHLVTLQHVLKLLRDANRAATKQVFAEAATDTTGQYDKLREDIRKAATVLRNRALHAPGA